MQAHGGRGDQEQHADGSAERDRIRHLAPQGIHGGEIDRPEHLPDVLRVRHERVGDANRQRNELEAHHRAALALDDDRDDARDDRHGEQRDLLANQVEPHRTTQRPVVEQEQHARQRHEHRLRHQAERERRDEQRIP